MTKAMTTIMFVSAMLSETIRTALIVTALNDLEVKLGDSLNAYVKAPVTDKVWTTLGPEFGKDKCKMAVIVIALHVLKSARAANRSHNVRCLESLGYEFFMANPDLWLR